MKIRLVAFILFFIAGLVRAQEDARPVVVASKVPMEKIANATLPTLYLVGDSTVRGSSPGSSIVGWGECFAPFFDTGKINVVNRAIAGRSARTYYDEGRWAKVADALKPGDFVLIQFGTNDQGRIGDPANKHRADGPGIGPETVEDTMPDGSKEAVHTFGWYMAHFATDAKSRGATVVLCSPVPHKQRWQNVRDFPTLSQWDAQVAKTNGVSFIDLTMVVSDGYRKIGAEKADTLFADKGTHTTREGAEFNAASVIAGLKGLPGNPLAAFFSDKPKEIQPWTPSQESTVTNTPATSSDKAP
jgi:lysophospholipase L1-like esterase